MKHTHFVRSTALCALLAASVSLSGIPALAAADGQSTVSGNEDTRKGFHSNAEAILEELVSSQKISQETADSIKKYYAENKEAIQERLIEKRKEVVQQNKENKKEKDSDSVRENREKKAANTDASKGEKGGENKKPPFGEAPKDGELSAVKDSLKEKAENIIILTPELLEILQENNIITEKESEIILETSKEAMQKYMQNGKTGKTGKKKTESGTSQGNAE